MWFIHKQDYIYFKLYILFCKELVIKINNIYYTIKIILKTISNTKIYIFIKYLYIRTITLAN